MGMSKHFAFTAAAAVVSIAYFGNAPAVNATVSSTTEQTAAAGLAEDALLTLEKSAYAAWKSKNASFWDTFLSENFVGWGTSGRLDRVSATKEYTGADCDINSYALSEAHVSPRGRQAALITYKITVDGSCGGQKIPTNSYAASVYIRDGSQWKATFHAQAAVVDPTAPVAKTVYEEAQGDGKAKRTAQDARTDILFAIERAVWEDWKDHDAKKLSALMAEDISFINIFGIYLANKAEGLKNWSGTGCDVRSVGITDALATTLSPTVGILTFKATADGTCFGQKVGPVWGSSIYVKYGDAWKWTFGINVPAHRQGAQTLRSAFCGRL